MKNLIGIMLLMVSMTVSAQESPEPVAPETQDEQNATQGEQATAQEVVVNISDFTGGTVSVKDKKGQEVTITVAPADGYYINTEDVEVIAVRDPASLTRSDEENAGEGTLPAGVTLALTLLDDEGNPVVDDKGEPVSEPADNTKARHYLFTVPEGLGAWVWKANFHEVDKPVTSGELNKDVLWKVTTSETETGETVVTLTLSGEGEAGLGPSKGAVTYPWSSSFDGAITDIVVEEGINAIGDGILDACTSLKNITLKGQKMVGLGKNELKEEITVDVYGRLYNEYRKADGWKAATIVSTTGKAMPGIAFGEHNTYDVFASKEALFVPSVLQAFTVTAIDGSNVKISEIKDDIIPAGVPVLLMSKDTKDDVFMTAASDKEGETEEGLLKAAGEGGQPVTLGEVYLLYNDVFYLSQAGTIPEGGVYLPVPVAKTRSFLTIGSDDTTAIESSKLKVQSSKSNDSWYDLSGRRLNTAPTAKGVYINGGKKYIIK